MKGKARGNYGLTEKEIEVAERTAARLAPLTLDEKRFLVMILRPPE